MNPETKTTYVIKLRGEYVGNLGGRDEDIRTTFQASQSSATRFNTVNEALTFITKATWASNKRDRELGVSLTYMSSNMTLVRLEESAGGEQRVVLGETEVCPQGAVVKYVVSQYDRGNPFLRFTCGSWSKDLREAELYSSQADAINALAQTYKRPCSNILHPTIVLRVAVMPSTPVITETVLS